MFRNKSLLFTTIVSLIGVCVAAISTFAWFQLNVTAGSVNPGSVTTDGTGLNVNSITGYKHTYDQLDDTITDFSSSHITAYNIVGNPESSNINQGDESYYDIPEEGTGYYIVGDDKWCADNNFDDNHAWKYAGGIRMNDPRTSDDHAEIFNIHLPAGAQFKIRHHYVDRDEGKTADIWMTSKLVDSNDYVHVTGDNFEVDEGGYYNLYLNSSDEFWPVQLEADEAMSNVTPSGRIKPHGNGKLQTKDTEFTIPANTTLFLEPGVWTADGARFALYLFNNNNSANEWVDLTVTTNASNIYKYKFTSAKTLTGFIFCRMNGGNNTNDWAYKWNQTGNLTYSASNQLYKITGWGENDHEWSNFARYVKGDFDGGSWDIANTNNLMTPDENLGSFTKTITVNPSADLKLKLGTSNDPNTWYGYATYYNTSSQMNSYINNKDGNIHIKRPGTYTITWDITSNSSNITITGSLDTYKIYYGAFDAFGSWSNSITLDIVDDTGIATKTITVASNSIPQGNEFQIIKNDNFNDHWGHHNWSNSSTGDVYDCFEHGSSNTENIRTLTEGTYTVSLDFINHSLTITGTAVYNICSGNSDGTNWADGSNMTVSNGIATGTVTLTATSAFKVRRNKQWTVSYDYSKWSNKTTGSTAGEVHDCFSQGDNGNINCNKAGTYTVSLNISSGTFTIEGVSSFSYYDGSNDTTLTLSAGIASATISISANTQFYLRRNGFDTVTWKYDKWNNNNTGGVYDCFERGTNSTIKCLKTGSYTINLNISTNYFTITGNSSYSYYDGSSDTTLSLDGSTASVEKTIALNTQFYLRRNGFDTVKWGWGDAIDIADEISECFEQGDQIGSSEKYKIKVKKAGIYNISLNTSSGAITITGTPEYQLFLYSAVAGVTTWRENTMALNNDGTEASITISATRGDKFKVHRNSQWNVYNCGWDDITSLGSNLYGFIEGDGDDNICVQYSASFTITLTLSTKKLAITGTPGSTTSASSNSIVYVDLDNSDWTSSSAVTYAYVYDSSNNCKKYAINTKEFTNNSIYRFTIDIVYTNIAFARVDPSAEKNIWNKVETTSTAKGSCDYFIISGSSDSFSGSWNNFYGHPTPPNSDGYYLVGPRGFTGSQSVEWSFTAGLKMTENNSDASVIAEYDGLTLRYGMEFKIWHYSTTTGRDDEYYALNDDVNDAETSKIAEQTGSGNVKIKNVEGKNFDIILLSTGKIKIIDNDKATFIYFSDNVGVKSQATYKMGYGDVGNNPMNLAIYEQGIKITEEDVENEVYFAIRRKEGSYTWYGYDALTDALKADTNLVDNAGNHKDLGDDVNDIGDFTNGNFNTIKFTKAGFYKFYLTGNGKISVATLPDYGEGYYIIPTTANSITNNTASFDGGLKMKQISGSNRANVAVYTCYSANVGDKVYFMSYLSSVQSDVITSYNSATIDNGNKTKAASMAGDGILTFNKKGSFNIYINSSGQVSIAEFSQTDFYKLNPIRDRVDRTSVNQIKESDTSFVLEVEFSSSAGYNTKAALDVIASNTSLSKCVRFAYCLKSARLSNCYNYMREGVYDNLHDDVTKDTLSYSNNSTLTPNTHYYLYIFIDYDPTSNYIEDMTDELYTTCDFYFVLKARQA